MPRKYINKLTIYLIKEEYDDYDMIAQNYQGHKNINGSKFYYNESEAETPPWVRKFFGNTLNDIEGIKNASSNGILLLKIDIEGTTRIFAIAFGHGRHLIDGDTIDEKFGLRTALNTISNKIKQISKKEISPMPKQSIEQIPKATEEKNFNIDHEQEILKGVLGIPREEFAQDFGKNIYGGIPLQIKGKFDIENIENILTKCYQRYNSTDYKTEFDWIDNLSPVKNKQQINELNNKFIEDMNSENSDKTWMGIPQIINHLELDEFVYPSGQTHDDINMKDFLIEIGKELTSVTLKDFKENSIRMETIGGIESESWKAYRCLYAETEFNDTTYILNEGEWFQINDEFLDKINNSYQELLLKSGGITDFPECNFSKEKDYNEHISGSMDYVLMDADNIQHGGNHSSIELCDLFSKNKELIHVKNYHGASTLSHLFNQGVNSAILIKEDTEFLNKANQKISNKFADCTIPQGFNPSEYKIIYLILSEKDNLEIPLFSKISLRRAKRDLERMNYNVFLKFAKKTSNQTTT